MPRRAIDRVAVVVPARDEETTIGTALDAVRAAATRVREVPVEVVVVANGCSDRTADVAWARGAHVLVRDDPNVGAARAAGAAWAMRSASDEEMWICTTDADSVVPLDWLTTHLEAADAGFDAFVGTVVLPPEDVRRNRHWLRRYSEGIDAERGHRHVHGANLGIRSSAYLRAGGFRSLRTGEDVDLVARLEIGGARIARLTTAPVQTSARHDPRAARGVGTDLADCAGPAVDDTPADGIDLAGGRPVAEIN